MLLLLKRWLISQPLIKIAVILVVVGYVALITTSQVFAAAGVNRQINFQGKVVNKTAGTNVTNGNYNFTFRIYDAASSGTLLWTENFNTTNGNQLTVTDGIFRVALGSVCSLSGGSCQGNTNTGVDFNSDSIYLDITFNGETMGTRVRFTAVPYALNAEKVSGLTVTNNGGNTLNIAASKTLTVSNTITFQGTDSTVFTLPTATDTIVGLAASQVLTNKSIGSTGLTFSGATTDVTTGTNEDFTIVPNGTGKVGIGLTAPVGKFHLSGPTAGKALAIFDETGDQNIFSASQSGVTVFNLARVVGTAANGVTFTPATTTNAPVLAATGTDTNIPFTINAKGSGVLTLASASTGNIQFFSSSNTLSSAGDLTLAGDLTVNGGDIVGAATTNLLNAATTVNLGSTNVTRTINIGTGTNADTINIGTGGTTADVITLGSVGLGNTNGSVLSLPGGFFSQGRVPGKALAILNELGDQDILTASSSGATRFRFSNAGDIYLYDSLRTVQNSVNLIDLVDNGISLQSYLSSSYMIDNDNNDTTESYRVVTNGGQSTLLQLMQSGNSGTTARPLLGIGIAVPEHGLDVDTATTGKALVAFNETGDQNILTASASGTTKFTIDRNGNAGIAGSTVSSSNYITAPNFVLNTSGQITTGAWQGTAVAYNYGGTGFNSYAQGDLIYASAANTLSKMSITGSNGQCLISNGTVPSWGACSGTPQPQYWQLNSGVLSPFSVTADLNLGATATSSAKIMLAGGLTRGKAAAIFNQTELDDIFSASFSATTRYTLKNDGSSVQSAVNLTGDSVALNVNSLTSGKGLTITSSATAFTGALQEITLSGSNASNTGSLLKLSNTGTSNANTTLYIDHRATGTNNLAMRIDDASGDTTPVIVDGDGRVGIGTTSVTGTTERLLQVGSPTNRGNAAIYGDVVTKGFKQIEALSNIKDVFVYDTSLDSDGGKWIDWADTEKLSWFTETLDDSPSTTCDPSTMDRCYSDAFPRRAILVVTTNALYIFDGTNGQMWMKFSQNAAGWGLGADTNNDPSSVTALNGVIYVGTNGTSAGGLYMFDFINDRMWNIDGTDRSGADVGIGGRNGVVTYNSGNNTNFDIATVGTVADWVKINDVSVAVLKNSASAIAAATGPNNGSVVVGLATDSGLTVINLTTQKVTQFSDATDNDYNAVVVTPNGRLYGLNEALGQAEMWLGIDYGENVATRVNGTPDRVWDENSTPPLSKSAPTIIAGAPDALEVIPNGSQADGGVLATAAAPSNSDLIYVGTNQGLTEIDDHQTAADGWSKFYTTTRQTPYMIGAARRMMTMDDASGNVTNQVKASILTAKNTPTYGVEGVRGKAMSFNGTNQFLCSDANSDGTCDTDATDNLSTGGWTISMWFKHSATITGTDVLFSRCYNTTPAAAAGCVAAAMTSTGLMGITVDFDATFTIGAATNNTVYHQSVQAFNDNQWHFLAITRAATTGNVNTMIDGKPIGQTAGVNTTLDASQILSIGADCSVGVACATGANFWDGAVDDFQYSAIGAATATSNVTTVSALHRLYNDARPLLNNKVINVTDATTATSTTLGDSGEAWIPQEFAGRIVTLTGGTGAGQTRRIASNTTTVLTVAPAFTTTPDTTTDFKIDSEALFGATNSVTAIGVTKAVPFGEARMMCAGTNDGADGGGVTCFNHQAGPNLVADIYQSDAKYLDDTGTEWTGSGYDNIQSIDLSNRIMVIGTGAHTWTESQDVRLGNAMDYFQGKVTDIRNQIQSMGTTTLAGMIGTEIGLSGGADLAENYQSATALKPGQLVAIDPAKASGILLTASEYQKTMLGVIATRPGLTLGGQDDSSYPVALTGRVPVIVTTTNGRILAGDPITSSTISGVGMRGAMAGTAVGMALEDSTHWDSATCSVVSSIDDIVWPEDDGTNISQPCFRIVNEGEADTYIGKLMVFMHPGFYQGDQIIATKPVTTSASITVLKGLAGDETTPQEELTMNTAGEFIITNSQGKEVAKVDKDGNMQITSLTGLPKLSLTDITGLDSYGKRLDALEEQVASLSAFPTLMSASAAVLGASDAAQLAPLHSSDPVLSFNSTTDATISGKLRVQGSSLFEDIVTIVDTLTTKNLVVSGFSTFFDDVLFKNTVTFSGRPVFNADTVGFVTIKKGEKTASVTYLKPYETMPVVMAQFVIHKAKTDQEQKTIEDTVFSTAPHYVISRQSAEGFTILLDKEASEDTQFSWTAFSQK